MAELKLSKEILARLKKSSLFSPDKRVVIGKGNHNQPEFLIFGETPGKEENRVGKPFVGRSGKILDSWIDKAGIKDKVYISNVVPFIPLDNSGKVRAPTGFELYEYHFFKRAVLKQVKPTFVITLGDSATKAMTILRTTRSLLGKGCGFFDNKLTAVYHPQYYSRRRILYRVF